MRLHTNLTDANVRRALTCAKFDGNVTHDVRFVVFETHGSSTHDRAFEIQLGTEDKHSLPAGTVDQYGKNMRVRRYKNSGSSGASSIYSATYFEWGWFMLEVFKMDPDARFGDKNWGYSGEEDFHEKTNYRFT